MKVVAVIQNYIKTNDEKSIKYFLIYITMYATLPQSPKLRVNMIILRVS
jgi:hypothetical protein